MVGPDELCDLAERRVEEAAEADDAARSHARARARVRAPVRRPRAAAGRLRRAGHRRPGAARRSAAARAPARARAASPSGSGTCWWTTSRTPTSRRPPCWRCCAPSTGRSRPPATTTRPPTACAAPARRTWPTSRRRSPTRPTVQLAHSLRCPAPVLAAAEAVVAPAADRLAKPLAPAREGGEVRFWRCASERAQAQAVAAERRAGDRGGRRPRGAIAVLVRSAVEDGAGGRRGAGGARGARSGCRARRPTSSAPRCATCWRGCGCWPTRPTPARRCARCRARRWGCTRWTSRA